MKSEINDYWFKGVYDYITGKRMYDNPYAIDDYEKYKEWLKGYIYARDFPTN